MLRWVGVVLGLVTVVWVGLQWETLSWVSMGTGIALASAMYAALVPSAPNLRAPAQTDEKMQWQAKMEEAESKASQTIDGLNRDIQKLYQKTTRAEERCQSYQKLVEVHQQEIEKLRQEHQTMAEQLIQKERKLSELYLSKMEPDLFDAQRRQVESINRELKKQLLDTKSELAELTRAPSKKKKQATPPSESRDLLS